MDIEAEINKMKHICIQKELTEEEIVLRDQKAWQRKVKQRAFMYRLSNMVDRVTTMQESVIKTKLANEEIKKEKLRVAE